MRENEIKQKDENLEKKIERSEIFGVGVKQFVYVKFVIGIFVLYI